MKSTLSIDLNNDLNEQFSRIVSTYVQGQFLAVRGGTVKDIWTLTSGSSPPPLDEFYAGMLFGFTVLDKEEIGQISGVNKALIESIFEENNSDFQRGFLTVVCKDWLKFTLSELVAIFCD